MERIKFDAARLIECASQYVNRGLDTSVDSSVQWLFTARTAERPQ